METITLTYDNHAAALASRERFWLALYIAALPDGDPTKRLVTFMALYARDVLTGELPGPYSDERARSFARLALVEPSAYRAHRRRGDIEPAGVLGLPVAEIPHVRREQHALVPARASARGAPAVGQITSPAAAPSPPLTGRLAELHSPRPLTQEAEGRGDALWATLERSSFRGGDTQLEDATVAVALKGAGHR